MLTNVDAALLPPVPIGRAAEKADDPDRCCDSATLSAMSLPKNLPQPPQPLHWETWRSMAGSKDLASLSNYATDRRRPRSKPPVVTDWALSCHRRSPDCLELRDLSLEEESSLRRFVRFLFPPVLQPLTFAQQPTDTIPARAILTGTTQPLNVVDLFAPPKLGDVFVSLRTHDSCGLFASMRLCTSWGWAAWGFMLGHCPQHPDFPSLTL